MHRNVTSIGKQIRAIARVLLCNNAKSGSVSIERDHRTVAIIHHHALDTGYLPLGIIRTTGHLSRHQHGISLPIQRPLSHYGPGSRQYQAISREGYRGRPGVGYPLVAPSQLALCSRRDGGAGRLLFPVVGASPAPVVAVAVVGIVGVAVLPNFWMRWCSLQHEQSSESVSPSGGKDHKTESSCRTSPQRMVPL